MRTLDGNTLADIDGAKNRVVEVIGLHRFLAAPKRGFRENKTQTVVYKVGQLAGLGEPSRFRPKFAYPKLPTGTGLSQANPTAALLPTSSPGPVAP